MKTIVLTEGRDRVAKVAQGCEQRGDSGGSIVVTHGLGAGHRSPNRGAHTTPTARCRLIGGGNGDSNDDLDNTSDKNDEGSDVDE